MKTSHKKKMKQSYKHIGFPDWKEKTQCNPNPQPVTTPIDGGGWSKPAPVIKQKKQSDKRLRVVFLTKGHDDIEELKKRMERVRFSSIGIKRIKEVEKGKSNKMRMNLPNKKSFSK